MRDPYKVQYERVANSALYNDLSLLNPLEVKERSGAELSFVRDNPLYTIRFLGTDYTVDLKKRQVLAPVGASPPDYQAMIVMVSYLVNSGKGLAPGLSGMEAPPYMLPSGDLFFKGPHELMKAPVAEAYGDDPEALIAAAVSLGAVPHRSLSFRLKALPFVEVYCYIEPGDEEFPPDVRYNFDSNIHYYLQLDAIFAMVNCLASLLVSLKK
jgi:hypothetical protein